MADSKSFLNQTAETASFAFREYFRPLVAVICFLKRRLMSSRVKEPTPEEQKMRPSCS